MITWKQILTEEAGKPYFKKIKAFLTEQEKNEKKVYPAKNQVFRAFQLTPFESVKVVIIGQDPYHQPGQAEGLAFSVPKGVDVPPSLRNILKEAHDDVGIEIPFNGSLIPWANHGVLLLNTILTVEESKPLSHEGIGWEELTSVVLSRLIEHHKNLVFMAWGKYAQRRIGFQNGRHLVLTAAHPSPLSRKGFLGCRHFSRANEYLKNCGKGEIDWRLK